MPTRTHAAHTHAWTHTRTHPRVTTAGQDGLQELDLDVEKRGMLPNQDSKSTRTESGIMIKAGCTDVHTRAK